MVGRRVCGNFPNLRFTDLLPLPQNLPIFISWIRILDLLKRQAHLFPTKKMFIVFDIWRLKVLILPYWTWCSNPAGRNEVCSHLKLTSRLTRKVLEQIYFFIYLYICKYNIFLNIFKNIEYFQYIEYLLKNNQERLITLYTKISRCIFNNRDYFFTNIML